MAVQADTGVCPLARVWPVTETRLSEYLAALEAFQHRLVRLAGDAQALGDQMAEAQAGNTVDAWAAEAHRIARELAGSLEVLERKSDAASAVDTAVLSLDEVADEG